MPTQTTLKATFKIPKSRIKNSNLMVNHIVSAQKSSWIREYAEGIWLQAVEEQFPHIEIIEPDLSLQEIPMASPEVMAAQKEMEDLATELSEAEAAGKELDALKAKHTQNKAALKQLKKAQAEFSETLSLEQEISDYEEAKLANTAAKKRIKATLTKHKKSHGKEIAKELGRIQRAQRKQYINEKIKANKGHLIFDTCAVIVRVHNISQHDFDAPNFYPTVKPILDAATDTGIIWADDNNRIIAGGTLFLFGEMKKRDEYIFEIEVTSEWPWAN